MTQAWVEDNDERVDGVEDSQSFCPELLASLGDWGYHNSMARVWLVEREVGAEGRQGGKLTSSEDAQGPWLSDGKLEDLWYMTRVSAGNYETEDRD